MEISREKRVKESIINELNVCLKSIQAIQQSRKPGEPIYTSDSSNQLCTVIEAALLHGHKSTRGLKRQQVDLKTFDRCVSFNIDALASNNTIGRSSLCLNIVFFGSQGQRNWNIFIVSVAIVTPLVTANCCCTPLFAAYCYYTPLFTAGYYCTLLLTS